MNNTNFDEIERSVTDGLGETPSVVGKATRRTNEESIAPAGSSRGAETRLVQRKLKQR